MTSSPDDFSADLSSITDEAPDDESPIEGSFPGTLPPPPVAPEERWAEADTQPDPPTTEIPVDLGDDGVIEGRMEEMAGPRPKPIVIHRHWAYPVTRLGPLLLLPAVLLAFKAGWISIPRAHPLNTGQGAKQPNYGIKPIGGTLKDDPNVKAVNLSHASTHAAGHLWVLVLLVALAYCGLVIMQWRRNVIMIGQNTMVMRWGVPLARWQQEHTWQFSMVANCDRRRTFLGGLLGYGTLKIEAGPIEDPRLTFVPDPDRWTEEISRRARENSMGFGFGLGALLSGGLGGMGGGDEFARRTRRPRGSYRRSNQGVAPW